MGVLNLPWGLTGALLATTYLHSICASAGPSINVGLKASFSSAPYLLELLWDNLGTQFILDFTDNKPGKLQQTRMQPHITLYSIELRTATSRKRLRTNSSMNSS
jgi:hypothetical protein